MKRLIVAAVVFGLMTSSSLLALADPPRWQVDPDVTLDPGRVVSVVTQLLALDPTIGDSDTTDAGVGTDVVGVDDSITSPPADPVDADPGHTYFVDNNPLDGDCPRTPYTTIQDGVDASGPGDTVKVCPGTYIEQVRIIGHGHDGLKLESLEPLQAVIKWPMPVDSFPFALVDINTANQVTLRGFTLTGPFPPTYVGDRHEGVLVENAFDEHIHHNYITEIRDSVVGRRGNQEGDAVAIGRRTSAGGGVGTEAGSAQVDHNVIDKYQKNGVQAVNSGTSVKADHNTITGPGFPAQPYAAPNGVVVFRLATGTIDHNIISGNHFTGSLLVAASGGVLLLDTPSVSSQVDHNRLFDNDYGVDTDQATTGISHNDVYQQVTDGIVLTSSGNVVQKNKVANNGGSGILLAGANNNLIKSNDVDLNGTMPTDPDTTDGIRVDTNSSGNQILKNQAENNVTHDCHDDSNGTGSGTPPTANTWQGNHGDTANRPGLCD